MEGEEEAAGEATVLLRDFIQGTGTVDSLVSNHTGSAQYQYSASCVYIYASD